MIMINEKKALFWLWITLALVILFTLFLSNRTFAYERDFYEDLSSRERSIARKMEYKYLGKNNSSVLRFKGDAQIEEDELVDGDVLILDGDLQIDGQVNGDVLAIFGDIELSASALVKGDVISVNGKVWTEDDARVRGDIVVTNVPDYDDGVSIRKRNRPSHHKPKKNDRWPDDSDEIVWADYTRVDGLTLGLQFPKPGWWANKGHHFALLGKGGYSFVSNRWQYQVGLERWTLGDFRFSVGGEAHDMTDTQDRWIICDHENALAAFFLKEDFRDYYNREGYSLFASQNFGKRIKLKAAYRNDWFRNLKNETNWSMFGGDKVFRPNPPALPYEYIEAHGFDEPMNIKSVAARLTIDTRNNRRQPSSGWYINAFAERAGEEFDNLYRFERYIVDMAHYFPLSWDEYVTLRVRGASSTGILPPMYWYDLGGISTLRGTKFKEMTGDRMVLGNFEYHLRAGDGNFLGMDIVLFIDSGLAWFANEEMPQIANTWPVDEDVQKAADETRPEDTFENLTWSSLRTNVGVAIASPDGDFRINFAKRVDKGGQEVIVTFRICQPF